MEVLGVAVRLDGLLETRIMEFLVHGEDLALSVDLPTPDSPDEAYDLAITTLDDAARLRRGDLALLQALTRREWDGVQALRIM